MKYIKLITLCLALTAVVDTAKAVEPEDIVARDLVIYGPLMELKNYPHGEPFIRLTLGDDYAIIWAREKNSGGSMANCYTKDPIFINKLRQANLGDTIYATQRAYADCVTVHVNGM